MSAAEYRPSVSELFAARLRVRAVTEASALLETNLMASMSDLNALRGPQGFARSWERAGNRLREERSMGLMPKRATVTSTEFQRRSGTYFDAAVDGEHVTVTRNERRSFVIVSASEYDRLKLDARLLAFEGGEPAPDGWPGE